MLEIPNASEAVGEQTRALLGKPGHRRSLLPGRRGRILGSDPSMFKWTDANLSGAAEQMARRVLLVDDDPSVLKSLADALRDFGMGV